MEVWTQQVTCKVSDAARDPLRSYFHEPQKNEIHLFYLHFVFTTCLFITYGILFLILQIKSYNPTCLVITFNSHHYDMT